MEAASVVHQASSLKQVRPKPHQPSSTYDLKQPVAKSQSGNDSCSEDEESSSGNMKEEVPCPSSPSLKKPTDLIAATATAGEKEGRGGSTPTTINTASIQEQHALPDAPELDSWQNSFRFEDQRFIFVPQAVATFCHTELSAFMATFKGNFEIPY